METNRATKRKPVPFWASLLIIAVITIAAFWFLGGQHYVANKSDIDYTLFHHPEDDTNPFSWLGLFIQSGTCSAGIAFVISSITLFAWNGRANRE